MATLASHTFICLRLMSSLLGSNSRLLPLAFREAAVWQKSRSHHCAWSEFYLALHMVLQPWLKLKCLCSRVVGEQSITTQAIVSFLKLRDKAGHHEWITIAKSIVKRIEGSVDFLQLGLLSSHPKYRHLIHCYFRLPDRIIPNKVSATTDFLFPSSWSALSDNLSTSQSHQL